MFNEATVRAVESMAACSWRRLRGPNWRHVASLEGPGMPVIASRVASASADSVALTSTIAAASAMMDVTMVAVFWLCSFGVVTHKLHGPGWGSFAITD
jgi:hypothetical protein